MVRILQGVFSAPRGGHVNFPDAHCGSSNAGFDLAEAINCADENLDLTGF